MLGLKLIRINDSGPRTPVDMVLTKKYSQVPVFLQGTL